VSNDQSQTIAVDWRSILVRYMKAVMDDDPVVGERCLTSVSWAPEWTDPEATALAVVYEEASK
jgi:hypothetical protein